MTDKNKSLSIQLEEMNDTTSLNVSDYLDTKVGWFTLVSKPFGNFIRALMTKRRFLSAVMEGINSLLLYSKIWEYQMRKSEGKNLLPPITEKELLEYKQHSR